MLLAPSIFSRGAEGGTDQANENLSFLQMGRRRPCRIGRIKTLSSSMVKSTRYMCGLFPYSNCRTSKGDSSFLGGEGTAIRSVFEMRLLRNPPPGSLHCNHHCWAAQSHYPSSSPGMPDDSLLDGVASGQREGRIRFADRVEAHLSRSNLRVTSFCP
jgi:hypothetical protein